jgi:hypothetical protein
LRFTATLGCTSAGYQWYHCRRRCHLLVAIVLFGDGWPAVIAVEDLDLQWQLRMKRMTTTTTMVMMMKMMMMPTYPRRVQR